MMSYNMDIPIDIESMDRLTIIEPFLREDVSAAEGILERKKKEVFEKIG